MTPARDPITACRRGCCWSPFACCTKRQCACHTADPVIPSKEPPVRRITYQDPTPGAAINHINRANARSGRR